LISAGTTAELRVDSLAKRGEHSHTLVVEWSHQGSDACECAGVGQVSELRYSYRGYLPFTLTPARLVDQHAVPGQRKLVRVRVASYDATPFTILSCHGSLPGTTVELNRVANVEWEAVICFVVPETVFSRSVANEVRFEFDGGVSTLFQYEAAVKPRIVVEPSRLVVFRSHSPSVARVLFRARESHSGRGSELASVGVRWRQKGGLDKAISFKQVEKGPSEVEIELALDRARCPSQAARGSGAQLEVSMKLNGKLISPAPVIQITVVPLSTGAAEFLPTRTSSRGGSYHGR